MHFDIAIFIDCANLSCFKDVLIKDPHEHKKLAETISGCTKLYLNIHELFKSNIVTYNYLVDAGYGQCESDSSVRSLIEQHNPNMCHTLADNDQTTIIDLLEKFNLRGKQRVLMCGLDLGHCVMHRPLGVCAWLESNHDVFLHKRFTATVSANTEKLSNQDIHWLNSKDGYYGKLNLKLIPEEGDFLFVQPLGISN